MAVTNDQVTFEIDIEVNKDSTKELKLIEKQAAEVTKVYNELTKSTITSAESMSDLNASMREVSKESIKTSQTIDIYSGSIDEAAKSTENMERESYAFEAALALAAIGVIELADDLKILDAAVRPLGLSIRGFRESVDLANNRVAAFATIGVRNLRDMMGTNSKVFQSMTSQIKSFTNSSASAFGDLADGAKTFSSVSVPGLFGAVEVLALATSGFGLLGAALKSTDSEFLNFLGTLSLITAALLGGVVVGIKLAVSAIGDFIIGIGVEMVGAVHRWTEAAEIAATANEQFLFTIESFARFLGTAAVGTIDFWNKKIEEMSETTVFSVDEIQKSITSLAKESEILGFTAEQNSILLDRAAEIASSSGASIVDATSAIISGLTGQSQALLSLGVDLRESSLSHSKFFEEISHGTGTMTDQQKTMLRYNEIISQTNPLIGASTIALTGLIGQQTKLNQEIDKFQNIMGEANIVEVVFVRLQRELLSVVNNLPSAFLTIISLVQEWGGVLLIVIGFITKWVILLGTLTTVIATLNIVLATNVTIQNALTAVFARLNPLLGAQAVAVTSLATLWANLALILKAFLVNLSTSVISIIGSLIAGLKVAAAAVWRFTAALLANPLFWKAAAIAAAIFLIVKAAKQMKSTMEVLGQTFSGIGTAITETVKLFLPFQNAIDETEKSASVLTKTLEFLLDTVKLSIGGVVQILGVMVLATLKAIEAIKEFRGASDEELAGLRGTIDDLEFSIAGSAAETDKILAKYGAIDETVNSVAKGTKETAKHHADSAEHLKKELDFAKGLVQANMTLRNQVESFGLSQVEQVKFTRDLELDKLGVLEQQLTVAGKLEDFAKDIAEAKSLQNQLANLKVDKLRADSLEDIVQANKDIMKQQKLAGLEGEELAKAQLEISLSEVDMLELQLIAQGLLTDKAQKQLDIRRQLLKQGTTKPEKEESSIGDSITEGIGIAGDALGSIFETGAELYSTVLDNAGTKMSLQLQNTMSQLVDGLQNVAENIGDMILHALDAFDKVVEAMPGIIQKFMDRLPEIINKLFDSLINFVDKLPVMFEKIMEKIPDLISQIMDRLPELIQAIFKAIPKIFASIISRIPQIISNIFDRLPMIIEEFTGGLIGAVGEMGQALVDEFILKGGLVKIVASIVKASIQAIKAAITGTVRGLQRAFQAAISGTRLKLPDIAPFEKSIDKVFKKVMGGATKVAEEVFSVIDLPGAGKDLATPPKDVEEAASAIETAGKEINGLWHTFLDALKRAWMWIWDNILDPFINALRDAWLWVWDTIISPIVDVIKTAWLWVWNTIISPIVNMVKTAWLWVWEKVILKIPEIITSAFSSGVQGLFDAIGRAFAWVKEHIWMPIVHAFQGVFEGAQRILDPIWQAFNRVFAGFVAAMSAILDGFKNLNFGDALTGGLGGGGGGGGGTLGQIAKTFGFANGGLVGGAFNGTDNQFIAAQPGEFVLNREATRNIGVDNLNKMNQGGSGGQQVSINFGPGSIQIGENSDPEAFVDQMIEALRRRSLDGDFVLAIDGLRTA